MMIKLKKSMGIEALIIILLISTFLIFMIPISSKLLLNLNEGYSEEKCRISVIAQSKSKALGKSVINLECPRKNIVFFNNKIEINGKKTSEYDFKKINDDIVNEVLANELKSCWYKLGEGSVNVFNQFFFDGSSVCNICAEITFDESVKLEKFKGLIDYLKTNKIVNIDKYYYDYLIKPQNTGAIIKTKSMGLLVPWSQSLNLWEGKTSLLFESFNSEEVGDDSFYTSKKYIIYFLGFKPGKTYEWLKTYNSVYYIGLGTADKVSAECTRLQN